MEQAGDENLRIDHRYAVHPQRLTLSEPNGRTKVLVDLWEPGLVLRWSEECLADRDCFANIQLIAPDKVLAVQPNLPAGWKRTYARENCYPILRMQYEGVEGALTIRAADIRDAVLIHVVLDTTAGIEVTAKIEVLPYFPAPGVAEGQKPKSSVVKQPVLSGDDAAARVLPGDGGTPFCLVQSGPGSCRSIWSHTFGRILDVSLDSSSGSSEAWIVAPHASCKDPLAWLEADCGTEWGKAVQQWDEQLTQSVRFLCPDADVLDAYRACLADQFVFREPIDDGAIGFICGTDPYRVVCALEIDAHVRALLAAGYWDEARDAIRPLLSRQQDDGRWENAAPWVSTFWYIHASYALMLSDYYKFTRDAEFTRTAFAKLLRLARWSEAERSKSKTRELDDPYFGLMPPGVGDGGLDRDLLMRAGEDKDSAHDAFFAHNTGNVAMLRIAAELAREFGHREEIDELEAAFNDARTCLLASLERCSIPIEGGRWAPVCPRQDCGGSLWQSLAFAWPAKLTAYDHPLVEGTIAKWVSLRGEGGLSINTGWLPTGVWPAAHIECLAPVYLRRGDTDALSALVYASLNHGSPVWTWPEERQPGAGTALCSGDLQEAWLPTNFCRLFRDLFLYEEENELHFAAGIPRFWLLKGLVGVVDATSHFGSVGYSIAFDWNRQRGEVSGSAGSEEDPVRVVLHVNLPQDWRVESIEPATAQLSGVGEEYRLRFPARGAFRYVIALERF